MPYSRAARNIRAHWLRDAVRVSVLVGSDLAVFLVLRFLVRALRAGALGGGAGDLASRAFPEGFLGGWRFGVALLLALAVTGSYGAGNRRKDTGRVLGAAALASALVLYNAAWTGPAGWVALRFGIATIGFGIALGISRALVDRLVQKGRSSVHPHRALLVMHQKGDARWRDIASLMANPSDFILVKSVELADASDTRVLERAIDETRADTVLLHGDLADREIRAITDVALASGCRLLAIPRSATLAAIEPKAVWVHGRPLVELTAPSLRAWQLALKRMLDVAGATVGLLLLSPVMVVIGLCIRLDSGGGVIFGQTRLGAWGRPFKCLKFRSMRSDAEQILRSDPALYRRYIGNHFKLPEREDPRLTRVGRFLRRTSLDELPQLFNVLFGHMSLVGPRPIVPDELDHYGGGAPLFLSLRPGITGAWAVNGRSQVGYPDRAGLELEYIRNWSVGSDIGILLRTIPAVLAARGAY